jgi:hypothetical protein
MKKIVLIATIMSIVTFTFAQNPTNTTRYFLTLSARGAHLRPISLTGHAFITWSTQQDTDTMIQHQTLGFYPKCDATVSSTIFENNKGRVVKGFEMNKSHSELDQIIIEVDSATWVKSQDIETKWRKKGYNLLSSNCVVFADKILAFTNIKRAKTKILNFFPITPKAYLRSVMRKNQEKTAIVYVGK